jgi:dienelactone hydrolase
MLPGPPTLPTWPTVLPRSAFAWSRSPCSIAPKQTCSSGTAAELPGADAFWREGRVDPDQRRGLGAAAQPKVDVFVYAGAQHGFGCDERASYSKPDYDLAQQRTVNFFARHLG